MTKTTCTKEAKVIKILSSVIHLSQMTAGRLEALGKLKLQKLTRTWIAHFEPIKSTNKIYKYNIFTIYQRSNPILLVMVNIC